VRALYETWTLQQGANGTLPALGGIDWSQFAAGGALTLAGVDAGGAVHFIRVGRALLERLGRPLHASLPGEDSSGMAQAYSRCARRGAPTHEFLRFEFGDGEPVSFERLLVPLSATDGRAVTHIAGLAIYEGRTDGDDPAH
jgi:hypothetical protein